MAVIQTKALIDQDCTGRVVSMEADELLSPAHGAVIMRDWRRYRAMAIDQAEREGRIVDLAPWWQRLDAILGGTTVRA